MDEGKVKSASDALSAWMGGKDKTAEDEERAYARHRLLWERLTWEERLRAVELWRRNAG